MVYSLTQAAQATGLTRQGVLAAIKRGTISGSKNVHGQWEIDAAELHRVYPLAIVDSNAGPLIDSSADPINLLSTPAINELQQKLAVTEALLREARGQVDELKAERDAWREEAAAWHNQSKALTANLVCEPKKRSLLARLFLAKD